MIELKAKLWRTVGAAALIAGGVSLAACSPGGEGGGEGGESAQHGEAGEAAKGETGGEGGEGAAPKAAAATGAEAGEAGAGAAYAGVSGDAAKALRLQHLKGFLLVAKKEFDAGRKAEAGALVGQGVLEVQTPTGDAFGDLDVKSINDTGTALMDGSPGAGSALDASIAAVTAKQPAADAELVRRMLRISSGLYAGVVTAEGVDPVEYQHSLGAALAAQDAFARAETTIKAKNAGRAAEAKAELARLVGLWASPDKPTPPAQVAAQASRVELALYGL